MWEFLEGLAQAVAEAADRSREKARSDSQVNAALVDVLEAVARRVRPGASLEGWTLSLDCGDGETGILLGLDVPQNELGDVTGELANPPAGIGVRSDFFLPGSRSLIVLRQEPTSRRAPSERCRSSLLSAGRLASRRPRANAESGCRPSFAGSCGMKALHRERSEAAVRPSPRVLSEGSSRRPSSRGTTLMPSRHSAHVSGERGQAQMAERPTLRFRYGWSPWFAYIIGGWLVALAVTLAIVVPEPAGKALIPGFNLGLAAFFFLRFAPMGPYFEDSGLRIRRVFSTDSIPWGRVRRFVLCPHGRLRLMAHVELTDGSFVWIEGVGAHVLRKGTWPGAEETIRQMNEALPRYQGRDDEEHGGSDVDN